MTTGKPSSLDTFHNRPLINEEQVWDENAWDNVEFTSEQESEALSLIEIQKQTKIENPHYYNTDPSNFWNEFYSKNSNKFFKDRHWLTVEFPEIFKLIEQHPMDSEPFNFMEIGCGSGSTVFPLMNETRDLNIKVFACDYSTVAVDLVKNNSLYNQERCKAFVYDITSTDTTEPVADVQEGTIDVISCLFVLSAIHPDTWAQAVQNIHKLLKPGGILIFRDYGRYDMAQLRFKKGRFMDENFYVRGDGTRVYFFTCQEIADMFTTDKFEILQNAVDRRLIVNRSRKLKMYRVWQQGKFRKN